MRISAAVSMVALVASSRVAVAQSYASDPTEREYWERSRAEAQEDAKKRDARLDELLRLMAIPVDRESCPLQRVDARLVSLQGTCRDLADEASASAGTRGREKFVREMEALVRECSKKYADLYVSQLTVTYYRADFGAVSRRMTAGGDVECLLAASHNAHARALVQQRRATGAALTRRQIANAEDALAATAPLPSHEPSSGALALQVLATVLSGMGQGLSGGANRLRTSDSRGENVTVPAPLDIDGTVGEARDRWTAHSQRSGGCSSDFSCGVGFTCVKDNFSVTGYCAKAVDAVGVQRFDLPSAPMSVGPKLPSRTDCPNTPCPAGFQCEFSSGTCVR